MAPPSEGRSHRFESCRVRQYFKHLQVSCSGLCVHCAQIVPKLIERPNSSFLIIGSQVGIPLDHLKRFVAQKLPHLLERNPRLYEP